MGSIKLDLTLGKFKLGQSSPVYDVFVYVLRVTPHLTEYTHGSLTIRLSWVGSQDDPKLASAWTLSVGRDSTCMMKPSKRL